VLTTLFDKSFLQSLSVDESVTTIAVFSSGLLDFPAEGLVINRVESRNVNPKNCSDLS
jgi:hypothetical protein